MLLEGKRLSNVCPQVSFKGKVQAVFQLRAGT